MAMRTSILHVGLMSATLYLLAPAATSAATEAPVIVLCERASQKGGFEVKVDSASTSSVHLLNRLNDVVTRRGHDAPVLVLVAQEIPLIRLIELRDVIGKAGFAHVRYYYYNVDDKRRMGELMFGPAAPFPRTK